MAVPYAELLRDPRWQRKRLEILNRSNFTCEDCGTAERTLNVHHVQYRKGAKPWEYEADELKSLCEKCHAWQHMFDHELAVVVARMTYAQKMELLGLALDMAPLKGAN